MFYMMTGKEPRSYQLVDGGLTVDPLTKYENAEKNV
jgi:hypothetical protein